MRVRIVTPGVGAVRTTYTDDWTTGATTYSVTAPRVSGTFVISAEQITGQPLDPDTPYVRIELGRSEHAYTQRNDRTDRPRINGVRLVGDMVVNTDKMRAGRLTRWDISARRPIDRYADRSAPEATASRAAAVVESLLTHWLTRPDNLVLRLAATRHHAATASTTLAEKVAQQRAAIEDARRELQRLQDEAAAAAILAAMPPAAEPLSRR